MRDKFRQGIIVALLSPALEKWRTGRIVRWLNGERILDCGCGSGSLLDAIGKDKFYVGIDIRKECIKRVKGRKNARFLLMDVERDDLRIGKFDTAVACALIEHLKSPDRFLSKISKLLTKNGRILITTPTPEAERILDFGSIIGIFDRDAYKDHKGYWDYEEFKKAADRLGLRIEYYEKFQFGLNQFVVLSRSS
jgi:2-polyprenyl-3-methyl-5-hydroxy-6-metoxy-1,4-benzoquinol methylase